MTDDYSSCDFFADESLVGDPYPYYEYLRTERGPVFIDPQHANLAVVVGHEEEMAVLRDHATFSSINSPTGPFPGLPVPVDGDDADPLIDAHRETFPMHEYMVTMDPPRHEELRSLMWRLFTPRQLKTNEAFMWRLADEFIDRFVDDGVVEFSSQYASPFAGLVIADLLGVPEDDMPRFRAWFAGQMEVALEGSISGDPLMFFEDSFAEYITERRARPTDDVLTALAAARFSDGTEPDVATVARESAFIFTAGQETTVRLITFAMRYLAEHPDEQERLRANRELIPNFLEEMLRLESPIKAHFRMARKTTTLAGVTIPAGMSVMLMNGAANRDPRRFECPHEVQMDRPNARDQVAFSKGVHSCLGQSLARAESRVTIERVLDRMADIRISTTEHGPPGDRRWEYLPTWLFRGLVSLHLEFE